MKRVKQVILMTAVSMICVSANAQTVKTSELQYQLVKELNAAHKLLIISQGYTDFVKQRMFLREANSSIAQSYSIFLKLKSTLKTKLSAKELEDLEGCFIFIQNMTLKDDFTPSDPGKIGLWTMLADKKLEIILPKVMR